MNSRLDREAFIRVDKVQLSHARLWQEVKVCAHLAIWSFNCKTTLRLINTKELAVLDLGLDVVIKKL